MTYAPLPATDTPIIQSNILSLNLGGRLKLTSPGTGGASVWLGKHIP
jgi:hypothetical protein